jgi:ClpP class serine protease
MDHTNTSPTSEIIPFLLSGNQFITRESLSALMIQYAPAIRNENFLFGLDKPKTYAEKTQEELNLIIQQLEKSSADEPNITTDYGNLEIPDGSIAYHRIFGTILSDAYYWFSTMRFERDIMTAEDNPQIAVHFLHINSGGGEAYYLDQISKTLNNCSKPIYVLIQRTCGSAAYYIGCHGTVIKAITQNDIIGCIGTMVAFWNTDKYMEKEGFVKVEVYATRSPLKNKTFNDLCDGKPAKYRQDMLDPLCEQFIAEVQATRPIISKHPDDHPILQGETYRSELAQAADNGLIDGITSIQEAIQEAHTLGQEWLQSKSIRNGITKLL